MVPTIITPALLSSVRSYPHLPSNAWYFITGVTLSMLNRPDEIPKVFQHALDKAPPPSSKTSKHDEQLRIARRLREALVKAAAIGGLPKVMQLIQRMPSMVANKLKTINALLALKNATPSHLLDEPLGYSPTSRPVEIYDMPSSQVLQRGQNFFDTVYGKVSKRVMGQMDRSGTEDLGMTARLMYGYILSNTSVLTAAESSFVLIAGLIPQDVS
jgi:hypothetical protein